MNGKLAGLIFFGICIILAILLLTQVITYIVSGIAFAAALVILGFASQRSRRK